VSLRLKINLTVGVLTILFVVAIFAVQFSSIRESVHEEVIAANRVALQLLMRAAARYAGEGTEAMLGFLQGAGRVRSNDITLLDAQGRELYRSPPSPWKVGRDAPQWFEKLISPPPATQVIDLPDGKLVVRANATRAALDAWDYFVRLTWYALALLAALNALVFWLVGRTVRPFATIVAALNKLEGGRFDVTLPRLRGTEAGAIGAAFNRMVGQLQKNIETERRAVRAERELSESRELARWIDHHIEQERRTIARELHDELAQSVTAMRSMALSIEQRIGPLDAQAAQAARVIADESSRLYDAMHGIIPRLTPLLLDRFGLAEALNELALRTQRSHDGVQIELQVELAAARMSGDVALALYRAAQEGMTNALRHGQARRMHLALRAQDDHVTLDLTDNGQGLPPEGSEPAGHYGLRWLTERVEGLGGELRIEAASPHGVHLWVQLPQEPAVTE